MEKKKEKVNYFFHWGHGGYNNVLSKDKKSVIKEVEAIHGKDLIERLGGIMDIKRDPKYERTERANKAYGPWD